MTEGVRQTTTAPSLDHLSSLDRVGVMLEWFRRNFENPSDTLPFDSRAGGFQWIYGGPFAPQEELARAFPAAFPEEIEFAARQLWEAHYIPNWTVARWRVPGVVTEREALRHAHDPQNPHASAVLETVLYPMRDIGWVVRATFVPGRTNLPLGDEFDGLDVTRLDVDRLVNSNLIELVALLLGETIRTTGGEKGFEESFRWLETLERDSELFASDQIVVHASPPAWVSLQSLLTQAGSAAPSALVLLEDPGNFVLAGLSYGGARIFLRIVAGAEGSIDALFERVNKRIRGDLATSRGRETKLPGGD